ncbi:MAG: hypothetical protein OEO17_07115 [Gemmatimonadota bacterium]|nr:hypothetical protein [Gemmatimonadota bacterium]MDH3571620.1 hypothetical protein [Gemmatimonadota bacterium]
MGRLVDLDDLVSARIVVARLGWRRTQRLHRARQQRDFPEPVKTLSRTLLWLWPDVRSWALGEGWVRWPGPEGASRVMVEPDDVVAAHVIADRLGLEVNDADEIPGLEMTRTDRIEGATYQWELAELLWHERANRTGRPS